MSKRGNIDITDYKRGSIDLTKIFRASTLIWERSAPPVGITYYSIESNIISDSQLYTYDSLPDYGNITTISTIPSLKWTGLDVDDTGRFGLVSNTSGSMFIYYTDDDFVNVGTYSTPLVNERVYELIYSSSIGKWFLEQDRKIYESTDLSSWTSIATLGWMLNYRSYFKNPSTGNIFFTNTSGILSYYDGTSITTTTSGAYESDAGFSGKYPWEYTYDSDTGTHYIMTQLSKSGSYSDYALKYTTDLQGSWTLVRTGIANNAFTNLRGLYSISEYNMLIMFYTNFSNDYVVVSTDNFATNTIISTTAFQWGVYGPKPVTFDDNGTTKIVIPAKDNIVLLYDGTSWSTINPANNPLQFNRTLKINN